MKDSRHERLFAVEGAADAVVAGAAVLLPWRCGAEAFGLCWLNDDERGAMLTAEEPLRGVTPAEAKRGAAGEEEEGRAGAPEQPVRRDGMRANSTSLHTSPQ